MTEDVIKDIDLQELTLLMETGQIALVKAALKEHCMSPYYFIGTAVMECVVSNNPLKASRYVRYAEAFIDSWFDNYHEESAFHSIVQMAKTFIAMYHRIGLESAKINVQDIRV